MADSRFIHFVLFYPRENATPADTETLLAGCKKLASIPGVLRLDAGTPAPAETPRAVVDTSFAVALLVEFADAAGHEVYQDHPDHLAFIAACSSTWSRVVVYDAITA